jgi:hypothetical protein
MNKDTWSAFATWFMLTAGLFQTRTGFAWNGLVGEAFGERCKVEAWWNHTPGLFSFFILSTVLNATGFQLSLHDYKVFGYP